jgi:hypothetical protein
LSTPGLAEGKFFVNDLDIANIDRGYLGKPLGPEQRKGERKGVRTLFRWKRVLTPFLAKELATRNDLR